MDQYNNMQQPPKSKVAAALLAFFLGGIGIHCFYLGNTQMGIIRLVLGILGGVLTRFLFVFFLINTAMGIWALVDFIRILMGRVTDANGNALV